jgi:flagellar motor component MotA
MIMEAVLSIQDGTSPNVLEEKLVSFLGSEKDSTANGDRKVEK